MPRPTAAQLAYGSCTVIFSTLAMLLLSETSSALGIVGITVIAVVALALGLLVALTVPLPKPRTAVEQPAPKERVGASVAASAPTEPVRERAAS